MLVGGKSKRTVKTQDIEILMLYCLTNNGIGQCIYILFGTDYITEEVTYKTHLSLSYHVVMDVVEIIML